MTVLSRTADTNSTKTRSNADEALFTIGYEKRSVDEYISLLLANDVALVIDVRKNPLSRKKGFSKKALANSLSHVGISYRHMPELGIDSSLRKNLKDRDDYDQLFVHYTPTFCPTMPKPWGPCKFSLNDSDV